MRTTLNIVDILYTVLHGDNALKTAISGKIYKNERPVDSKVEDIVINSLPVTGDQLQAAIGNVNIHIPNLKLNINNVQDNSQPDLGRLGMITDLVVSDVEDYTGPDYWFFIQQQTVFPSDVVGEYYSNIRVNFFSENIKN